MASESFWVDLPFSTTPSCPFIFEVSPCGSGINIATLACLVVAQNSHSGRRVHGDPEASKRSLAAGGARFKIAATTGVLSVAYDKLGAPLLKRER